MIHRGGQTLRFDRALQGTRQWALYRRRGEAGATTYSRKGVAQWDLRRGDEVGVKAVLRGEAADRRVGFRRAQWAGSLHAEEGWTVSAVSGGRVRLTIPSLRRFPVRERHYDALRPVRDTPVTVYRSQRGSSEAATWRRRRSRGRKVGQGTE